MKSLKEDFFDNLGIGIEAEKEQIKNWLEHYRIRYYHIIDDLIINVNGGVDLSSYKEEYLPDFIQFGEVLGYFDISYCKNLKSLKGCPKITKNGFYCGYCNKLKNLEYAPEVCAGGFNCNYCDNLISLKGCPKLVNNYFQCVGCPKLKSLKFGPSIVNGTFNCSDCGKQFKIEDVIKICPKINLEYVTV